MVGDRCRPIAGHPGFIGEELAGAGNTPVGGALVFGGGYRADVFTTLSSFDSRRALPDMPDGPAIGVSVLTAIIG